MSKAKEGILLDRDGRPLVGAEKTSSSRYHTRYSGHQKSGRIYIKQHRLPLWPLALLMALAAPLLFTAGFAFLGVVLVATGVFLVIRNLARAFRS